MWFHTGGHSPWIATDSASARVSMNLSENSAHAPSGSIPPAIAGCPTSRWFFARCGIPQAYPSNKLRATENARRDGTTRLRPRLPGRIEFSRRLFSPCLSLPGTKFSARCKAPEARRHSFTERLCFAAQTAGGHWRPRPRGRVCGTCWCGGSPGFCSEWKARRRSLCWFDRGRSAA